jgi:hypothetical protein
MTSPLLALNAAAAIVAFVVGYLINQGGTCAVAASREVGRGQPPSLFLGFAAAAGAAGMITFPLAGWLGPLGHLGSGGVLAPPLFWGALLVAIGAVLNDACLLGSLWRLGNGEVRLLFLPIGLALGFVLARDAMVSKSPLTLEAPAQPLPYLGLFFFLLIASLILLVRGDRERMAGRLPLGLSMTLLGFAGSFLFVARPGWTYADLVKLAVDSSMKPFALGYVLVPALMTIAGALVAALRAKTFQLAVPVPSHLVRTVAGGVAMAFGASLIPGGNDSLLLGAIPSGSLSGTVAYLTMNLLILVIVAFVGRRTAIGRDFH